MYISGRLLESVVNVGEVVYNKMMSFLPFFFENIIAP